MKYGKRFMKKEDQKARGFHSAHHSNSTGLAGQGSQN
jgi:hypothetical protein